MSMLAKRVNRIGMSTTLRISAAAKALRAEGKDVVDLSIGEPDFPTPAHVKDAAKRALDRNATGYTANEGIVELRRAICQKHARENNLKYEPDEVIVSPGAKYSLYLAVMVLVEKGEDVIIPAPYWVSYPEQVRLVGGNPVFVPTREEDGFRLTAKRLKQVLTFNTKLLILNYPSNPAGVTYTREQLAELAEVCRQEGIWILADEIYEKLSYDGHAHVSIASISPEIKKRTILVNGFSKSHSMTGWRLGWAAGPREVIQAMNKIQSHSTSNPTSIAQWAGVAALEGPQGEVGRMAAEFARRRNYVLAKLRALDGVTCDEPRGAFYLFPNMSAYFDRQFEGCPIRNSYGLAYYLLKQAHVAVVPGEPFGGEANIRISYATSMDRLEAGMARIAEALSRLERPRVVRRVDLDNVATKVDRLAEVEVTRSQDAALRLADEANRAIAEEEYHEWNAAIGGVVVQLRTNSPHLVEFYKENFYPAQLESDLEPHAIVYGIKGMPGRQPGAVYHQGGRAGFVINTAYYGQLRSLALEIVADTASRLSGVHVVRAAAVDVDGRGLLLMGAPGCGVSAQLFALLKHDGVRLVSTDTVFVRSSGREAIADVVERKLYVKTRWVRHEPRLSGLFDRSHLENAVTSAHSNELCDGGDDCPVTRGQGACYAASTQSRALLDPYWLGGTRRHAKRTGVRAVAIFRREPVGSAVQPLAPRDAVSMLEHATAPGPSGGPTTVPWLNENLHDSSSERLDTERRLFERLFQSARPYAVNTAYAAPEAITAELLGLTKG
jgi:aspartate/methionine/tyrosine aminotransferase